ncbi:MAG: glycosyltransferase family 39 protein [bacterium]
MTEPASRRAASSSPWLATLAAVLVRLGYALAKGPVGTDEALYLVLGHNLWSGKGFTLLGAPHLIFPPLFPWILGGLERLVGSPEWASRVVFILAGAGLVPIAHALARRALGGSAARWAAWLVAVSPTLTSYVSSWFWGSMSEPLFLFLAYGGWLAVLATNERLAEGGPRVAALAVTAGLAFGGAYLTRPEGVAYAVLGAVALGAFGAARAPRRLLAAALLAASFAGASFPYVHYLHRHTGRWTLSAKSGVVLEMAFAMLGKDPLHRKDQLDVLAYEALGFTAHDLGGEAPKLGFGEDGVAGRERADTFFDVARREPLFAVGFAFANAWDLARTLPSRQVHPWPLTLLSVVGAVSAWRAGAQRRRGLLWASAAGVPVAAFTLYGILPRFLVPVVPAALLLAAAGIEPLARWAERRIGVVREARLGVALVVTLALFGAAKTAKAVATHSEPIEYRVVGDWLRANVPENALLMCRKPEIAFYARRPMVALVAADAPGLLDFARKRHVTHLVLDRYAVWGIRPALRPLFDQGHVEPGLDLVHRASVAGREVLVFEVRRAP